MAPECAGEIDSAMEVLSGKARAPVLIMLKLNSVTRTLALAGRIGALGKDVAKLAATDNR